MEAVLEEVQLWPRRLGLPEEDRRAADLGAGRCLDLHAAMQVLEAEEASQQPQARSHDSVADRSAFSLDLTPPGPCPQALGSTVLAPAEAAPLPPTALLQPALPPEGVSTGCGAGVPQSGRGIGRGEGRCLHL